MSARVGDVGLPLRKLSKDQIAPLRTNMIEVEQLDASVDSGGGLGNDGIWVRLEHDYYFITGRELLAAVLVHAGRVDDAARIPGYPEEEE